MCYIIIKEGQEGGEAPQEMLAPSSASEAASDIERDKKRPSPTPLKIKGEKKMSIEEMKAIVQEKIRKGEPIHGFMREIAIEIALDEMAKEGA